MADYSPFGSYSSSSSTGGPLSLLNLPAPSTSKKKKDLTARQLALLLKAMQDEQHRSFGDRLKGIGKGALGGATWTLDKLMRPSWAVSAGVSEALGGESDTRYNSILSAMGGGFTGEVRKGFGEILDEQGVLEGHGTARGIAGFGLDVATDPLMLASIAAAPVTGGTSVAAYTAAKASGKAVSRELVERAAREAGEEVVKGTARSMVEENLFEELLEAGGKKFQHRLAAARFNKAARAEPIIEKDSREMFAHLQQSAVFSEMARAEARLYDPRKLQLILGTRKHGVKLPLGPALVRPGAKLAQREIPVISQLSDTLGRAFVPGFRNDIFRAGEIARQHTADYNAVVTNEGINRILGGVASEMDEDTMLAALHYMEQPLKRAGKPWKAIVPDDGQFPEPPTGGLIRLYRGQGAERPIDPRSNIGRFFTPSLKEAQAHASGQKGGRVFYVDVHPDELPPKILNEYTVSRDIANRKKPYVKSKGIPGTYKVNDKYLKALMDNEFITPEQADFITKYFKATEFLRAADEAAGVGYKNGPFQQTNRMYVPRVTKPGSSDIPKVTQTGLLTEAGFQKGRKATVSLQQVKQWVAEGKMEDVIETNPITAIGRRSRAGSERQADMALINSLRASIGIPMRIVDEAKVGRAVARLEAGTAKFEGALRVAAAAEQAYDTKLTGLMDELEELRGIGNKAIEKGIRDRKRLARKEKVTALEQSLKRARKPERKAQLEKEIRAAKRTQKFSTDVWDEINALRKQGEKLESNYLKAVKAAQNPKSQQHKKLLGEELVTLSVARKALADARDEVAKAQKYLRAAKYGKANPKARGIEYTKMSNVHDAHGNDYVFPKEAAASIARLDRLVTGEDKTVADFANGFGKWMGAWKILVTTVNPGYRFRNTMTDFWNMWVAGVPTWAIGQYGAKAARTMARAKKGDPVALNQITEAANHGILSGLFAGDIQAVAQFLKHGQPKKQLLKDQRYIALSTKIVQDINRNAENWGRLTHLMYRRDNLRESLAEATYRVKIAHFDYSDLTPFEQDKLKKIFPFYTWTRKNIPYQVRQILAEPGRYSAFPKLAQEAEYAAHGEEGGGVVPDYVERNFGFALPKGFGPLGGGEGDYYMPQFGVSDLAVFQSRDAALDRVISQVGPHVKLPLELALNKSFFTGQDIAGDVHPRNPVTPLGANLLSMIPGSDVGQTARKGPGGEIITGPGANPYLAYVAGQIPWARTALVSGGGIKGAQTDNSAWKSLLAGQSVQQVDPEIQAYYNYIEVQDQVDKMLQGLRDEGRIPTKKREPTDFDKLIEEILKGNY